MSIEQHAEATAFYKADPKIVVKNALAFENGLIAAFDQGGNQIPEIQRYTLVEVLNLALRLKARVEALEGLGPLIEEYAGEVYDSGNFTDHSTRNACEAQADRIKARIDAILKGGAP